MTSRITRNLSVVLRAERLIARRHAAVMGRKIGLAVAAAILGAMGLILLDVAAYLALAELLSPPLAALFLAFGNLVLAVGLIAWSSALSADRDVAEVAEVRDMALADLEAEMQDVSEEIRGLAHGLRRLSRDPLGTAGASLLGPLLAYLIRRVRK